MRYLQTETFIKYLKLKGLYTFEIASYVDRTSYVLIDRNTCYLFDENTQETINVVYVTVV